MTLCVAEKALKNSLSVSVCIQSPGERTETETVG